ncbi:MAG TPA: epoxide hydrolase [Aldersonia sp.]
MTEFRIAVPEAELTDLRDRLARTRWPDRQPADDWSYGLPLHYARDLAAYWRDEFDWRAAEVRLNRFPQFTSVVDGATVHFLHVSSARDGATPLLLTHGWPGSFVEFLDMIEPLTAPPPDRPAFHVVVPTIPGYGFSGHTADAGWDPTRIARAWATLMQRLGYERYLAHGGDWGAMITHRLMREAPDALLGAHVTMLVTAVARTGRELDGLPQVTDTDRAVAAASAARAKANRRTEMGYGFIQSTKPQTLAYGLADSPAGQLAWIVEKFHKWTDNDGFVEDAIDRDTLLTNVSIYWFTNTAGSSARLYFEANQTGGWGGGRPAPSQVPLAVLTFPRDLSIPVRRLAEQHDRIVRWTEHDRGGHFPGFEHPDALVEDLRDFAAAL